MTLRTLIPALALAAAVAVPAGAQDRERHRPKSDDKPQAEQQPQQQQRADQARRQEQGRQQEQAVQPRQERRVQPERVQQPRAQQQTRSDVAVPRQNARGYDNHGSNGRYENHGNEGRRWDNRRYESYVVGTHRYNAYVIHPHVVRVAPYRPYVYRPSFSIGAYYGADGYYPYGYTPRGYFEPIPGRAYGGLRIAGAPRDAQVFADGYYVGIVDDFDGIFQHINLEAGPHHIEVAWGGYQPMAFDVYVRPGETTTFRADGYFGTDAADVRGPMTDVRFGTA